MTAIAVGLQLAATDPEQFKAGPIGLLMLVLMAVAVFFLARSMGRHLRKVPARFDRPDEDRSSEHSDDDRGPATS